MKKQDLQKALKYIDSWLPFRFSRCDVPGMVVAVSYKNELAFNKAYGYANVESNEKMTPDHVFRIASHSKTFTATAIMQLKERGKLRLDDYVAEYLPWVKDHRDKRWKRVTLRQLLSHSAGVVRDGTQADFWSLQGSFPTKQEFKKQMLKTDIVIENNTRFKYSNFGYTLLGLVIEEVTGETYNQYVQENILKPLILKNTGAEYDQRIARTLAVGYSRKDIQRVPISGEIDTRVMSSATGFYSTSADLCKYFHAHMVGSKQLLDDESKKEMQRTQWYYKSSADTQPEEYGLGMDIYYMNERKLIGHGGGFPGYITKSYFDPKDDLVVVALTNCIDGPAYEVAGGVVSVIDKFVQDSNGATKQGLSKFEGRFMDLWDIADIVTIGDKIYRTYPNTWYPFYNADELECIDPTSLKITKTSGHGSLEETVNYSFQNGKVKSINFAGATMLPEEDYMKSLKSKKRI